VRLHKEFTIFWLMRNSFATLETKKSQFKPLATLQLQSTLEIV
jgi:hypothetical protein